MTLAHKGLSWIVRVETVEDMTHQPLTLASMTSEHKGLKEQRGTEIEWPS